MDKQFSNDLFVSYKPVEFIKGSNIKNSIFRHPRLIRNKTYSLPAKPKVIETSAVDNYYADMIDAIIQENDALKTLLQTQSPLTISTSTTSYTPSYTSLRYTPFSIRASNYSLSTPTFKLNTNFEYPTFRVK